MIVHEKEEKEEAHGCESKQNIPSADEGTD